MQLPPPDPKALLEYWLEWEAGDTTPGEVLKNLKKAGMKEVLTELGNEGAGETDGE